MSTIGVIVPLSPDVFEFINLIFMIYGNNVNRMKNGGGPTARSFIFSAEFVEHIPSELNEPINTSLVEMIALISDNIRPHFSTMLKDEIEEFIKEKIHHELLRDIHQNTRLC